MMKAGRTRATLLCNIELTLRPIYYREGKGFLPCHGQACVLSTTETDCPGEIHRSANKGIK